MVFTFIYIKEIIISKIHVWKLIYFNLYYLLQDQEQADIIYKDGISDSRVRELKRMTDELRQR